MIRQSVGVGLLMTILVACGASHRQATPGTTIRATSTTTVPFPDDLPPGTTQVLLQHGNGDATIPVNLPKGTYSFQAECAEQVPLAIPGITTFVHCYPVGGNTVTAEVGPLHQVQVQTTAAWTLYIGKSS